MMFKICKETAATYITVELGLVLVPDYDLELDDKIIDEFNMFGLYELQEGVYELSTKKSEIQCREFLIKLGFKEIK